MNVDSMNSATRVEAIFSSRTEILPILCWGSAHSTMGFGEKKKKKLRCHLGDAGSWV
jgi:hypothetical protein